MKTIKEAAKEYAANRPYLQDEPEKVKFYKSFLAGVAFAQQWISTDEEFPNEGSLVLVKDDESRTHIASVVTSGITLDSVCNEKTIFEDFRNSERIKNVKFWRPIELK
jgi:hypothetical protein